MELLSQVVTSLRSPKPLSIWERYGAFASVLSAVTTAAAAAFAATSAWPSLRQLNEARIQREPVLSVEPGEHLLSIKVRDDREILFDPLDALGVSTQKAPTLILSNFGPAPALNITLTAAWDPKSANLTLPKRYADERADGGARFQVDDDQFRFALTRTDGLGGASIAAPVGLKGSVELGIVPPSKSVKATPPLDVAYSQKIFLLRDAERQRLRIEDIDRRLPELSHKGLMYEFRADATTLLSRCKLGTWFDYDTVTRRHYYQEFVLEMGPVLATDRTDQPLRDLPDGQKEARIEGQYQARVLQTALPRTAKRSPGRWAR